MALGRGEQGVSEQASCSLPSSVHLSCPYGLSGWIPSAGCEGIAGKAPVGSAAGCGKGTGTAGAQTEDPRSARPSNAGEEKFPFCLDGSSCVGDVPDTHELVFKDWCFLLLPPKKTPFSSYKIH